jgi:hypothetical protein
MATSADKSAKPSDRAAASESRVKPGMTGTALHSPGLTHAAQFSVSEPVQLQPIVQLALDAATRRLPPGELGGLDNFLTHNGRTPAHYSAADYATLGGLYTALTGHDTAIGRADGTSAAALAAIPAAYDALATAADTTELRAGNAGWIAAVTAGANAYMANRGGGFPVPAAAAWTGRGAMPVTFQAAIEAAVVTNDADVAALYQDYRNTDKLLAGTINAVKASLGPLPTLQDAQTRLLTVYRRQTTVSHENWVLHLGEPGRKKTVGAASLHYTIFNDAIAGDPLPLRIEQKTVKKHMDILFEHGAPAIRIHATDVQGGVRYHKYYGGTYSANIGGLGNRARLDAEYNRMIVAMRTKVQYAKDNHGRIGNNRLAAHVNAGP